MRSEALEIRIMEVNLSFKECELLFEVYNRMFDNYLREGNNLDEYLKLGALKSKIEYADQLMKAKAKDCPWEYAKIYDVNDSYHYFKLINQSGRYNLIKDYFYDDAEFSPAASFKNLFYDYCDNELAYHFIDNELVDDETWDGYQFQGFYHYYEIMELYQSLDELTFDITNPKIDDIFNCKKLSALVDLSRALF